MSENIRNYSVKCGDLTIYYAINSDCLINKPFKQIYPMKSETSDMIYKALGMTNYDSLVTDIKDIDVRYDFKNQRGAMILTIGKAIKAPYALRMIEAIRKNGLSNMYVIVPRMSSGCANLCIPNCIFIEIERFMAEGMKNTIPNLIGRYSSRSLGEHNRKSKHTVQITVSDEGFPELGLSGKVTASDIYKVIENRVKAIKPADQYKEKGFDLFLESFKQLQQLLIKQKNITAKDWNSTINQTGLLNHIKQGSGE